MNGRVAVVAIGGNSLIKDARHQTVPDQYLAAHETIEHIVSMIKDGWNVVITHGNGPQVGFILRRSEIAARELHEVPLDVCGADTQGAIGYALQQNLQNAFRQAGLDRCVATIISQTEVAADDPAAKRRSSPALAASRERLRAGPGRRSPGASRPVSSHRRPSCQGTGSQKGGQG